MLANPENLWLLAALPIVAVIGAIGRARRWRDWAALGQGGRPSPGRPRLWLACLAALAVALAGPRWGRSAAPPRPPGHDVVLALDVSRSMGALDAVPDRLAVAVEAAEGLAKALEGAGGDRVAVVAFAGRGVLRCPLTASFGAAAQALRKLRPGAVRPGGTDLGAGLLAALDAFDEHDRAGGRAVVLFSDGEDHAGRWPGAAERLRERGVVVHTVAIGDDQRGHFVPARADEPSEPLRFEGVEVLSSRSDAALRAVSRETGGSFVPLGLATTDLGRLYRSRIEPSERARRRAFEAPEPAERFGLFLIAALLLGVAACRPDRPRPSVARGWAFALAMAIGVAVPGAAPRDGPSAAVAEGRAAYDQGRFVAAVDAFRRASRLAPGSAVPHYDAAAALFRLGRYAEARAGYLDARSRVPEGDALRTKIDFALGNTALALGDPAAAIGHYDDCLATTARGGEPDRVRRDAAINRRFAEDQVTRAPAPDDEGGTAPRDRTRPRPGDGGPGEQRPEAQGKTSTDEGGGSPSGPSPERRGSGGAGGGGPAPPGGGSPEDRLSKALENVREARDRRIDEPVDPDHRADRKDW